jgi:tetratricopeptide (TPR) repeat protein
MSRTTCGIALGLLLATGCGGKAPPDGTTPAGEEGAGAGGAPASPAALAEAQYDAHMNEAAMAQAEGRLADALSAYLAAADVYDRNDEVIVERAEAHYLAGDIAYQQMQKDVALEQYQKAVDIYLRFSGNSKIKAAVVLTNMGVVYKEKVMKDKARNCWETALQLYKEAPDELKDHANIRKIEQNIRDLDAGF